MDATNLLIPDPMLRVVALAPLALIQIGIFILVFLLIRRLLRLLERRSIRDEQFAELTNRLRSLEERLEDIAEENERLSEDQRFVGQLLAKRPADRANE